MPYRVSFVATASDSGKTTLIEKVVPLLKNAGLRVAVMKHASEEFELDTPGKDSWRLQQAGADAVVIACPGRLALVKKFDGEPTLKEIEALTADADIVIHEGFKREAVNRIEVFRSGVSGERPLCIDDPAILALASDTPFDVSIPRFDLNDAESVASFIIRQAQTFVRSHGT
jgi:molybdopterin-guanine dinucleotide biosynthesis adapter protein